MEISVTVKFENRKEKVEKKNEKYIVYVKSLPEKGKANCEVIREIAKYFQVSEKEVKIVSGIKSRRKVILISN
jgi:uncharacterized protein (TIGR00251 family)